MQTSGPTAPSFASLGSTGTQLHQSFGNAGQQNNAYQSGAQANFAQQNVTAHSFGNSQPGATQISQPKVFHPQPVTQQAQPIQSRVPTASNPGGLHFHHLPASSCTSLSVTCLLLSYNALLRTLPVLQSDRPIKKDIISVM